MMFILKTRVKIIFIILFQTINIYAYELTFLTHFIKPYSYLEKSSFKGFAVEIVKEMMQLNNHPISFKNVPFKRGLVSVLNKKRHVLFIVARRPNREHTLKWVGPLVTDSVYFYKNKKSLISIYNVKDAKKVNKISVERGNADYTYLKEKGFLNLIENSNQAQSLQMLYLNRAALTPIAQMVLPKMAKYANLDPKNFVRTNVKLYDSVLYLAFSKDIPDYIIKKWQDSLDLLKSTGRYKKILEKYMQ